MKPTRLLSIASFALLLPTYGTAAVPTSENFFVGEPVSEFTRYRVYPLVDRALRSYKARRYNEAALLLRQALKLAPQSVAIRLALARSLYELNALQEANAILLSIGPAKPEAAALLLQVRLKQLSRTPYPSPVTLKEWLTFCSNAQCAIYAESIWNHLVSTRQATRGEDILTPWLKRLKSLNPFDYWVWTARLAQQSQKFPEASDAWAHAAKLDVLTPEETLLYGLALLKLSKIPEALALVDTPLLNTQAGRVLANNIIERSIELKQPKVAAELLAQLAQHQPLSTQMLTSWLRLSLILNDTDLAKRLSTRLATDAKTDAARERLLLYTWYRLKDTASITAYAPRTEAGEKLRTELLANAALKQRDFQQVLSLLPADLPASNSNYPLRLQALAASGEGMEAAQGWAARYRLTQDLHALDTASYLLQQNGQQKQAAELLATALPFPNNALGEALYKRLFYLYQLDASLVTPEALHRIEYARLPDSLLVPLAELWRRRGDCHKSEKRLLALHPLPNSAALVLGHCYAQTRPGLAISYFQRARDLAPESVDRWLAYLHDATGWPDLAMQDWLRLPSAKLSAHEKLAAARVAFKAGHDAQARRWLEEANLSHEAEWHSLRARLIDREGKPVLALQAWDTAEQLAPNDPAIAMEEGKAALKLGNRQQALQSFRQSVKLAQDNPQYLAALGFAQIAEAPLEATQTLSRVQLMGPEAFPVDEALTYLYQELGDNPRARKAQTRAIDNAGAYLVTVPEAEAQDREYALRMVRESLDRRNTFGINSWLASNAVPGELLGGQPTDSAPKSYVEANAEWRLGKEPVNNNRFIALTSRIIAQRNAGQAFPGDNRWLGLGLRAKPFSRLNLYLAGEQQWGLGGTGSDDFLLRMSASFLDQGSWRQQWHASGTKWWQHELYLDAARWVRTGNYATLARYTLGFNRKLSVEPTGMTLMPYTFSQAEYTQLGRDIRAGLGLAWRLFADADRYTAWRQEHQLKLESQSVLSSELATGNGWFLKYEGSW